MRYAFAGDRAISVQILSYMMKRGYAPSALLVSEGPGASHADELRALSGLPADLVFVGKSFSMPSVPEKLRKLELDYIIGIHFPYVAPKVVLDIPAIGVLNLHPAYLPYNKGWHTPSWAILDDTPYGATLHFMDEALDQGDIIHQKRLAVHAWDTAESLYQRALALEVEVFQEAFDHLCALKPCRKPQYGTGTSHCKKDLKKMQQIDLQRLYSGEELIRKLRGLSTNHIEEAAYYEVEGKKISIQVLLKEL